MFGERRVSKVRDGRRTVGWVAVFGAFDRANGRPANDQQDSCHKVEQGKYEYEVCIFGKATQRDIGQRSGGTNLGQWHSATVDENSGKRLLKSRHAQRYPITDPEPT